MRKLLFTFLFTASLMFASNAQCGPQATQVGTECGTYCLTMVVPLTGSLEVDIANYNATNGTMRRKPTITEMMAFADEIC